MVFIAVDTLLFCGIFALANRTFASANYTCMVLLCACFLSVIKFMAVGASECCFFNVKFWCGDVKCCLDLGLGGMVKVFMVVFLEFKLHEAGFAGSCLL